MPAAVRGGAARYAAMSAATLWHWRISERRIARSLAFTEMVTAASMVTRTATTARRSEYPTGCSTPPFLRITRNGTYSPPDDGADEDSDGGAGTDGTESPDDPEPRRMVRYCRNRGPLQNNAPIDRSSSETLSGGGNRMPACLRMSTIPRRNRTRSRTYITQSFRALTHDPPFPDRVSPVARDRTGYASALTMGPRV